MAENETAQGSSKIKAFFEAVWLLLTETVDKFSIDRAWQKSAALAFFVILSLAPMLLIIVRIIDRVYDPDIARIEIVYELGSVVGDESAQYFATLMDDADEQESDSIPTFVFLITILLGATSFFSNLKHAMDQAWGADLEKTRGVANFLRTRSLAFLLTMGVSFVIIFIMIGDAVISFGSNLLENIPEGRLLDILHFLLSATTARVILRFMVITVLIALVYKILPDAFIMWRDAFIGAGVTALLMSIGQIVISLFLRNNDSINAYGAASSLMVLLVWLYYTALAFFYGVEFTYAFAQHYGTPITPQESPLILHAKKTYRRLRDENDPIVKEILGLNGENKNGA